jgi:prepilin-type N-terminal cleavage/methylation domain-containing protein
MRQVTSERGLTLIELLVVLLILGILALIALPNYFGSLGAAQANVRAANVASINTALALYAYRNNGQCPPSGPDASMAALLGDSVYFPDGVPLDPTVNPPSSASFVANYNAANCRTQ